MEGHRYIPHTRSGQYRCQNTNYLTVKNNPALRDNKGCDMMRTPLCPRSIHSPGKLGTITLQERIMPDPTRLQTLVRVLMHPSNKIRRQASP